MRACSRAQHRACQLPMTTGDSHTSGILLLPPQHMQDGSHVFLTNAIIRNTAYCVLPFAHSCVNSAPARLQQPPAPGRKHSLSDVIRQRVEHSNRLFDRSDKQVRPHGSRRVLSLVLCHLPAVVGVLCCVTKRFACTFRPSNVSL
jgi:hypothetical protein